MARPTTDEQRERRRNAARRNGTRSRGPSTSAGKFKSSKNRLSHGCYAKVHALPDENAAQVNHDHQRWFNEKRPRTIEQELLVEECFRGQLMSQRFHRARDRVLIQQQEDAIAQWEEEQDEWVAALKDELVMGGARTVAEVLDELRTFGAGVRYLIGALEGLGRALDGPGFWDRQQAWTAVRMLGFSPGPAAVAEYPEVYRLALCNFLCMPEPPETEIERMLEPDNRPRALRETPRAALVVPAAECRAALKKWVDETLEDLRVNEEQVVHAVDIPALEALCEEAAIIKDPAEVRKFHRMGSEYRTTIYKSLNLLHALQKGQDVEPPGAPGGRDRPEPARTSPRAAAGPASAGAPGRPRVRQHTADIETPTTAGESSNGPENVDCRATEASGGQGAEWFSTDAAGGSRFEPSRADGAADEPSVAAPTGPVGDGPVFREGEAPAEQEPRRSRETRAGQERGRGSEAPWWVPGRQSQEGWPASHPGPAGAAPGRPPPGAG
jgi:hypothetical protein